MNRVAQNRIKTVDSVYCYCWYTTTGSFRSSNSTKNTKSPKFPHADRYIFDVSFEFMSIQIHICIIYSVYVYGTDYSWSDSCPITLLMVVILRSDISSNEIHFIPSSTLEFMYIICCVRTFVNLWSIPSLSFSLWTVHMRLRDCDIWGKLQLPPPTECQNECKTEVDMWHITGIYNQKYRDVISILIAILEQLW